MRHRFGFVLALCLVALLGLLAGCQPSPKGPGADGFLYTNRQVSVRTAPRPDAPVVVMAGPNAQVTVLETRNGYSRIGLDDGRIEGWVETDALASGAVRETAPARRRAPAVMPRPRPAAKPPIQPAAQQPAPGTPEPAAPAPTPTTPAPAAPAPAPAAPAPQEAKPAPSGTVFSPGEAQAAPPPAQQPATSKKPAPTTGKQARPDAFDPF